MTLIGTPMIGQICLFPYHTSFTNFDNTWTPCEGQLLDVMQFQAFFAVIGNRFGGDGYTTFAVPNLKNRVALHWGQGPGLNPHYLAEQNGQQAITLTGYNLPAHNHGLYGNADNAESGDPTLRLLAKDKKNRLYKSPPVQNLTPMGQEAISHEGGGSPHFNLQPYLVMRYFIAHNGYFPSRN